MQYSFPLINVIFLNNFVADFASIGNIVTRQMLERGKAANDEHLWEWIWSAFQVEDPEYNNLRFSDEVFENLQPIDPSQITSHEWQKVRSMWKDMNVVHYARDADALLKLIQSIHNQKHRLQRKL